MNLRPFRRGLLVLAAAAALAPALTHQWIAGAAFAQGTPVYQSGLMTAPHDLAKLTRNGQLQDASGILGDAHGRGVNPFAITDALGLGLCADSAVTGGAYNAFCLGHDAAGNGLLTLDSYGGLSNKTIYFRKNGTLYEIPFAAPGGVVGPVSSTTGDAVLWDNNSGSLIRHAGAPPGLRVATNAALKALAASAGMMVRRDGFAAANDGGQMLYLWSSPACTLGSGSGDDGLQVQATPSGCWLAQLPHEGADIRIWGVIGTADDTAIAQKADTAMGAAAWPLGTAKALWFPRQATNLMNWYPVNVQRLAGAQRDASVIQLAAAATTTDTLVQYRGAGPLLVDNLTFKCPLPNPVTYAQTAGVDGLRVGAITTPVQSSVVEVRHVKTVGCQNGARFAGVEDLLVEDMVNDRPFDFGWIVTDVLDTATVHTRRIRVRNTLGINPGQYCGSAPANGSNATLAAEELEFRGIGCVGAGFKDGKLCFDLPSGTSVRKVVVEGWGANCFAGGLEAKLTLSHAGEMPVGNHNINVDFVYYSNFDGGIGVSVPFEGSGTAGDLSDVVVRGRASYSAPGTRLASTYYAAGQVFSANGNTYKVATPGTTDSSGGPAGVSTGITDGTAQVDYLQATPAGNAASMACGELEGVRRVRLDLTCQNTAYGLLLGLRGGTGAALSTADINLVGIVSRSCLYDSASFSGNVSGLRLSGSCVSAGDNAEPLFNLGSNAATNYLGFEILGGSWRQTGGSAVACLRNNGAASFALQISGGAHFQCARRVMYLQGPSTITVAGGGLWEITDGTNGAAAITASGASATGSVDVTGPVRLQSAVTTSNANYASSANVSAAAVAVYGRFLRGFLAATPTGVDQCVSGDIYHARAPGVGGQPAQGWYCSVASGNTWVAF